MPRGVVICVGGPPHSGKSVFLTQLNRELVRRCGNDVFLERANPDGEGNWAMETSAEVRAEIRRKSRFTDAFVQQKLKDIEGLAETKRLVLVDLGGKLAPDVDLFLTKASHALIISSDPAALEEWTQAVTASGCELLGAFHSELIRLPAGSLDPTVRSQLNLDQRPWSGVLRNLDRDGPSEPYRNAIEVLSESVADTFVAATSSCDETSLNVIDI